MNLLIQMGILKQNNGNRILTYHRVADDPSDRLAVSLSQFRNQLRWLRDNGIMVVGLDDIFNTKDRNTVAITFDDGYLDNYENAMPLLNEFGYSATIFIATGFLSEAHDDRKYFKNKYPMLSWEEVRGIKANGIDIGSHSCSHNDLSNMDIDRINFEIKKSKAIIESKINDILKYFCYPDGRCNALVREALKKSGYRGACSVIPGVNTPATNPFMLKRTEISGLDDINDFKKKISGAYDCQHRIIQWFKGRKTEPHNDHEVSVLHVIDSLVPEGAEHLLLDIMSSERQGPIKYYVCSLVRGGKLKSQIEQLNIPVMELSRKFRLGIMHLIRLIGIFLAHKPDIVHTHLFSSSMLGRIAAMITRRKMVVTEHNTSNWKSWYHKLCNRILSSLTHRIIAVSETVRQSIIEDDIIKPDRISVIRNGILLSRMSRNGGRNRIRKEFSCHDDEILAVTVAALTEQKGHSYLIQAIKKLRSTEKVKYAFVGDGYLRDSLKAMICQSGKYNNIIFTGSRLDVQDILDAADIFIFPSLYEGLSLSLIEAACMAKPVITTTVGSNSEIFKHNETAIMVPPADPDALMLAIEHFLNNTAEATEMGKRAYESVRSQFSIENTTRQYELLYMSMVN